MRAMTSKEISIFDSVRADSEALRKRGGAMARAGFPLLACCYRKLATDLMATMTVQRRQALEPETMLRFNAPDTSDDHVDP